MSCQVDSSDEETCTYLLFDLGALGLEIKQLSDHGLLIAASFDADTLSLDKIKEFHSNLQQSKLAQAIETLKIESVKNEDWLSNWKKHFEPFTVGNSFLICPPWKEASTNKKEYDKRKKIIIDPGMAFGTGLHATTRFCLEAIERHAKGPNVLDVGTGSGILSIACASLSIASYIVAIDIDENSIANAEHNIDLNQFTKQIQLEQTDLNEFRILETKQFNTLLSNLTAEVIIELLPDYDKLLAPNSILILAGIIEERFHLLETALAKYPLKLIEKTIDKGWVGLVLTKT